MAKFAVTVTQIYRVERKITLEKESRKYVKKTGRRRPSSSRRGEDI